MKNPFNLIKIAVFILALAAFLFFAQANAQIRVNVGGPAVTQPAGVVWAADTFNLGTADGGAAAATVKGTDSPQVFKTARWYVAPATYAFTVEEGKTYTVRLHSADTWANTQKVGARLWSASVNGQARGPIDIFARVGANAAHVEQWTGVKPVAGKVNIILSLGTADNPVVSAIEILPESSTAGWTRCGAEGQECIFSGTRSVRYGSHVVNKWSTPKDLPSPVKCNSATFGDSAPGYAKQCELADIVTATLAASWSAPEANTDGSPLAGPLGYRVERAPSEAGPWAVWASVGTTSATGQVPYGKSCIRVIALTTEIESEPSEVVCLVKAAPILKPGAPTKVKAQ